MNSTKNESSIKLKLIESVLYYFCITFLLFGWFFNHAKIEEYRNLGILGFISCVYTFLLFLQIFKCRMKLSIHLISWIISMLVLVLIFYIVT